MQNKENEGKNKMTFLRRGQDFEFTGYEWTTF